MRTFDADLVNAIYKEGDTSALVNDPRNIVLVEGENIGLFAWRGPGIYECSVCGDCGYGDNEWSEETIMECQNET